MSNHFKYLDSVLEKIEGSSSMKSITDIDFNIPVEVVDRMFKSPSYTLFFTHSHYSDNFFYTDIVFMNSNIYMYLCRSISEPTYRLKIIHNNNTEELKIFLRSLKKIN
jgi:hypothetical protein